MSILAPFKRIGLVAGLFLTAQINLAQAQDSIPSLIIPDGKLTIVQDPKIDRLLALKKEVNEDIDRMYYRIQLYYGSLNKAEKILGEFRSLYPDWRANLYFETPYYKVHVGRYTSRLTADQRLAEVKKKFPSAFLLAPQK
ncbi:SPOR domain-containing protein [Sungkyunkwania multivorans]|uniref:SPOR domain-containing protein n=1 Tax=Sungkyunkwania multivorans TaxID=1173618 RepID=A0ABW3CUW1_9FLAO